SGLLVTQLARALERREPRAMENLVRIRVADAGDDARVGERALQRVVLTAKRGEQIVRGDRERLDAAGIERAEFTLIGENVQRCTLPAGRLGEEQRARREIERREADL